MTPAEFVRRWEQSALGERSAYQQHFLGLCDLIGHPHPAAVDPTGDTFTFEKGVTTVEGRKGFADVWKRDCFAWEYKGKHKNLSAAYVQLLQYREALDNPPLLVVCDTERIVVHTNYTRFAKREYTVALRDLLDPAKLDVVRRVFLDPDSLRPDLTREAVTTKIVAHLAGIADGMRARGVEPRRAAKFLTRVVFCLFVEDVELLEDEPFTKSVASARRNPVDLSEVLSDLFRQMAKGGRFGSVRIDHFNGGLFDDADAVDLTPSEIAAIEQAAKYDWVDVDLSVFGTLFERTLDPGKRGVVGSHYTSREDVETLLKPVLLAPLEREWADARADAEALWARVEAATTEGGARTKGVAAFTAHLEGFQKRLAQARVLDPACGSGNFLYVSLALLLNLEKEVVTYRAARVGHQVFPLVSPDQILGIEKNPFAKQIATVVVWIGYLQWQHRNGYLRQMRRKPILGAMTNVDERDAILCIDDSGAAAEPEWPDAEFIVGNPPFLGGKLLRSTLGDGYVERMFQVWKGRVAAESDLVAYWFEKARAKVEAGGSRRVGLIATQAIRGGANREALSRIKRSGDIFFAVSDREWVLDGAAVHISMVGFDNRAETQRELNGAPVATIHSNLTASIDVTKARRLAENAGVGFMGDTKNGPFELPSDLALRLIQNPNVNGKPSSDVVTPWTNTKNFTQVRLDEWIIDYGPRRSEEEASLYDSVFDFLRNVAQVTRATSRSKIKNWWLHERPRPDMRAALDPLPRFIVTGTTGKHRIFAWLTAPTLPDHALIAFARSDDYFFGILHSRIHELWARAQGTQLREVESGFRYTPTTCFETFPFPEPFAAGREAVAAAARRLDELRTRWLNPPELTRREVLTFPGSVDGPWRRYVRQPNADGIGTVHFPRVVPRDAVAAAKLKKRTLTALYNERPAWLDNAHRRLDEAVADAYGWKPDLTDDEVLSKLLDLNLQAAGREGQASPAKPPKNKANSLPPIHL